MAATLTDPPAATIPGEAESPLALLSAEQIEALGREFDAIHDEVYAGLGERDARYIRSTIRLHRQLVLAARVTLLFSRRRPAWLTGTAMLSLAKILENMEIGHNVMHGQWDWMNDPDINSRNWDWDTASPADAWRHSHNYEHHTFTNIRGKDRDLGYEIMRIDPHQKWHPVYLLQPLYNMLLMGFFEWGVAMHDLNFDAIRAGEKPKAQALEELKAIGLKARRQIVKDYLAFPALSAGTSVAGSGPREGWRSFKSTLAANFTANIVRNVWAYSIIFCGHFPDQTYTFSEAGGRRGDPRRVVRAPTARLGQHRRRRAVPLPLGQPQLPGRASPVPRHALEPLRGDRAAGEGRLRALRAPLQHRSAAPPAGHRASHDPAPRLPGRAGTAQARPLQGSRRLTLGAPPG